MTSPSFISGSVEATDILECRMEFFMGGECLGNPEGEFGLDGKSFVSFVDEKDDAAVVAMANGTSYRLVDCFHAHDFGKLGGLELRKRFV